MNWIQSLLSKLGDISSKRVCGILGFLTCLGVFVYCTISLIQAPTMVDMFLITSCSLLGIDSIMSPFKKKDKFDE